MSSLLHVDDLEESSVCETTVHAATTVTDGGMDMLEYRPETGCNKKFVMNGAHISICELGAEFASTEGRVACSFPWSFGGHRERA